MKILHAAQRQAAQRAQIPFEMGKTTGAVLAKETTEAVEMQETGSTCRPTTAERVLQRQIGWHRRRGQLREASSGAIELGYLFLLHGRTPAARGTASQAQQWCGSGIWTCGQIGGRLLSAWAWLTEDRVAEAESAFRLALTEAAGHQACLCLRSAQLGLARCLIAQHRTSEARVQVDGLGDGALVCSDSQPPGDGTAGSYSPPASQLRLAPCHQDLALADVHVRLAVAEGRASVAAGWLDGLRRAGHPTCPSDGAALAVCQVLLAGVLDQPREAANACASGLRAARASHAPLLARELRVTFASALVLMGRLKEADALVTRLCRSCVKRGDEVAGRLEELRATIARDRGRPAGAVECASVQLDAADVLRLLRLCGDDDDDERTLMDVCHALRDSTGASGVAVFRSRGVPSVLAFAGSRPTASDGVRLAIASGRPSGVADVMRTGEAASPVKCAGETIGAVAARWAVRNVPDAARHVALLQSAASAIASVVRSMTWDVSDSARQSGVLAEIAGSSLAVTALRREIAVAASAPFPVLIHGESGTGKELVAKSIHTISDRRLRRFCAVNCAALPDELCEAELFGHARGAYTGATADRAGLFEEADGGTLLLDEVGELSPRSQAKLLRAIQEGEVRRLGENSHRRVDPRIIAASNRPLQVLVTEGRFRNDLLFRLDVIRIEVPALRDRAEDIPSLAMRIWRGAAARVGSQAELTSSAVAALSRYHWPGNVRELQNVLYALVAHVPRQGRIGADRLPPHVAGIQTRMPTARTLEAGRREFECSFVREALARAGGRRCDAARQLGVTRQGFAKLLARLRIEPEPSEQEAEVRR